MLFKCFKIKFEFSYSSGVCIPETWLCDGQDDCSDKSDEGPAACANHTDFVAPHDGMSRDLDGEDVVMEPCPEEDSFQCKGDGHCFPKRFRCDGKEDCHDKSDEGETY